MARPLKQIDDEIREMTEEEFAEYEALLAALSELAPPLGE
jgi:hypothetical protein